MDNNSGGVTCAIGSWLVGALAGFLAFGMLLMLADWMFMQAAFIGALVFLVSGALVSWLMCRPLPAIGEVNASRAGEAPTVGMGADTGNMTSKAAPVAAATAAVATPAAPAPAPTPAPAAAPAAAEGAAPKKAAPKKAAAKSAAPKAATAKAPAKKAPAKKAAPKKAEAKKAEPKPVAADGKPELLKKARAGGPDDLKQIKGVGPKMEGMLHDMGIFHFDQVGSWRKKEVEWVDANLDGFNGRVSRDEWVKQAKVLAKGGATDFSKKVKKGGVY